jgi:hypothetical protein
MFNYKRFLRALPAAAIREHLHERSFQLPHDFDWDAGELTLVRALAAHIDEAPAELRAELIADWQEAGDLGDEPGCRAIQNACPAGASLAPSLKQMSSYEERALWVLREHRAVFRKALEIRFFDDNAIKLETRRTKLNTNRALSLAPADLRSLADAVAAFYRKHEGSGDHCVVEVTHRHTEGSVQLTLYLEGLADSRAEFEDGHLQRRRAHPAMELALVHDAKRGIVETAVRGGKKYHDMLLATFVEHLLKADVDTEALQPQRFDMSRLRRGVAARNAVALGIQAIRLKRLVLAPPSGDGGLLTIDATANPLAPSAEKLAEQWFPNANPLRRGFQILQATVAIHFVAPDEGRPRRPIYIEFRRNGTIKWDKIGEHEREMVLGFMAEWGMVSEDAPLAEAA